jgi:hypothetical protein
LSQSDPEITYEEMESSWEDGILRVMHLSISRLAYSFTSSFEGSIYQCNGRRNALDRPVLFTAPYIVDRQHQHMEGQLHSTQIALDHIRQRYNFRGMTITRLEKDLRVAKAKQRSLAARRSTLRFAEIHLRARVRSLQAQLTASRARVAELEDEPPQASST